MQKQFKDLRIGDQFDFDPQSEHKHRTPRGPWVKVSPAKYCHADIIASEVEERHYAKMGFKIQPETPVLYVKIKPLTCHDLMKLVYAGKPFPVDRVLATFADKHNWIQIYNGGTNGATEYEARACEWAFIGPSRPPYELAQSALEMNFGTR